MLKIYYMILLCMLRFHVIWYAMKPHDTTGWYLALYFIMFYCYMILYYYMLCRAVLYCIVVYCIVLS